MDEIRRSAGKNRVYRRQARLGWLFSLAVAALSVLFIFGVWLTPVRVYGESMSPALADGEIVLCDRLAKYFVEPARGDVVLFSHGGELLLKRIVSTGNETVEVVNGGVYINSRPLDERGYTVSGGGDSYPLDVPAHCAFILSDNRSALLDSRDADIGAIPMENVLGVLRFRIFPLAKFTFYY